MKDINLKFKRDTTDTTKHNSGGWRDFEPTMLMWDGSASGIYSKSDAAQRAIILALDNKLRLFMKWVPNQDYTLRGDRRLAMIGAIVVTAYSTKHNVADYAAVNIAFKGSGAPIIRLETEAMADNCDPCCEGFSQSFYAQRGDTFVAPPAPSGSTGWIVEKNFYPREEGDGDIGEIFLDPIDPSTGLPFPASVMDCPVHTTFHYLCVSSEFTPEPGSPEEEFISIWENTASFAQEAVIKKMEQAVGFRIGDEVDGVQVDALYLFLKFNYIFLPANPAYILDISYLGLTDLSIVNTFTNLKNLNASHNYLTIFDFADLVRPEIFYLDCSYNFIGNDNLELAHIAQTVLYLDMSYNYLNECLMFSSFAIASNRVLDYFDVSANFIARIFSNRGKYKELYFKNNTYPTDSFWGTRKNNSDSSFKIANTDVLMNGYTVCERVDFSNTEIEDEVADPETIATRILADNVDVTTIEQARARVGYNPKWSELSHEPYNPLNLPRYWNDQNLT